jgi:hypothetical protein
MPLFWVAFLLGCDALLIQKDIVFDVLFLAEGAEKAQSSQKNPL